MATDFHDIIVPVLDRAFTNLAGVLRHGEAWAKEHGIAEADMLNAKLADDMAPLTRQVQIASDTARGALARIAGTERPAIADTEATFAELQQRVQTTLDYIRSIPRHQIDGREQAEVTLPLPSGEMTFTALAFLQNFALPNTFFHLVTAYDILRHRGVPLGKMVFLTGS